MTLTFEWSTPRGVTHKMEFREDSLDLLHDMLNHGVVEATLEATRWNQTKAAELLGVGRDWLRYHAKKFDIVSPKARARRKRQES